MKNNIDSKCNKKKYSIKQFHNSLKEVDQFICQSKKAITLGKLSILLKKLLK